MLEDRDYMRATSTRRRWSLTAMLLVANLVVFVVQQVAGFYARGFPLGFYFALSVEGLRKGCWWQPITFQFLHAGIWHLAANLITIYFFGRAVEQTLGGRRFLGIYFGSGVFGGLLQVLAMWLLPVHFGLGGVLGASAGAFGLVAGFAVLYPEQRVVLLPIPFSFRAKFLLLFEAALTLVGIIWPFGGIAHAAHLGGIIMGLALTWRAASLSWPSLSRRPARPVFQPRALASVRMGSRTWAPAKPPVLEELPPSEFISKEVDPILEKISAHGFNSLTPREKRILEAASAKIKQR